ncbi:YtzC family protein [Ectobacillus sp. sgz5001026]|uniref:YtzC family protein n=1 Tax=Ectobacillus sp. sgz5001026 TaxID=3242473 RepID=UPI0036D352FD
MTDRSSLDQCISSAQSVLETSKEQVKTAMKQEHYNDIDYSDAQFQLEQALLSLESMMHNANAEQRERIDRMVANIRNVQHQMIITPH